MLLRSLGDSMLVPKGDYDPVLIRDSMGRFYNRLSDDHYVRFLQFVKRFHQVPVCQYLNFNFFHTSFFCQIKVYKENLPVSFFCFVELRDIITVMVALAFQQRSSIISTNQIIHSFSPGFFDFFYLLHLRSRVLTFDPAGNRYMG